jgi:hypothetical protein
MKTQTNAKDRGRRHTPATTSTLLPDTAYQFLRGLITADEYLADDRRFESDPGASRPVKRRDSILKGRFAIVVSGTYVLAAIILFAIDETAPGIAAIVASSMVLLTAVRLLRER